MDKFRFRRVVSLGWKPHKSYGLRLEQVIFPVMKIYVGLNVVRVVKFPT